MAGQVINESKKIGTPSRISEWQRFRRVFFRRWLVIIGLSIIILFILLAIFSPIIAPYPPNAMDLNSFLQTPNSQHWLGTDSMGRDNLSRVIYGTRTSLEIGLLVVLIAGAIGLTLGLVAGYAGGWAYNIIMRIVDALMSFPLILLTMVIAALLGSGMKNVIIALSIGMIPGYARLMCTQIMSLKENDYVSAERSIGAGNIRIMFLHLLPNSLPPIIIYCTMMLGSVILAEAALSFLGLGIKPPVATWGGMITDGREYLLSLPMLSFAPGFCLMLVVFAFNMVGDGLRDALDPRLRGSI